MKSNQPPSQSEGGDKFISLACGTSDTSTDGTVTNGTVPVLEENEEDGFQANSWHYLLSLRSSNKSVIEKILDASKH